jgi:hypothetical protein
MYAILHRVYLFHKCMNQTRSQSYDFTISNESYLLRYLPNVCAVEFDGENYLYYVHSHTVFLIISLTFSRYRLPTEYLFTFDSYIERQIKRLEQL